MKKLIIANWKMNPGTEAEALALAEQEAAFAKKATYADVIVCPPVGFLESVSKILSSRLGAQDCFWEESGAYTGEVSPEMLKDAGVSYVIIGHSERRALGETDEVVAKKVKTALAEGLTPILCVGESLEVRNKGMEASKKFVATQLKNNLSLIYNLSPKTHNLIIAYEPIWSISTSGSGKVETPKGAMEMIAFIRNQVESSKYKVASKILYGGSVNPKNAKSFLSCEEIDGVLVGGASLDPVQFSQVIEGAK